MRTTSRVSGEERRSGKDRAVLGAKRLSWSVLDSKPKTSLKPSPKAPKSSITESQALGPTTSSVARMKALIAKANAEKDVQRSRRSTSELQPSADEAEVIGDHSSDGAAAELATTSGVDGDGAPQVKPAASGERFRPPDFTKRGASANDLLTKTQADDSMTPEPELKPRRGGSRLFGLTKHKPEKEKKKHERKERQREKKEEREREREQEKEEIIALLYDRLQLWREREKIPENVQFMSIKQLKAEKKWLKKELNSLDSKREREELRVLHLRRKELSFYLERMKKDKTGAAFLVSSSAAIQTYSALLKDAPPSVGRLPLLARTSPSPQSSWNYSPLSPKSSPDFGSAAQALSPPTSPPLSPSGSPPNARRQQGGGGESALAASDGGATLAKRHHNSDIGYYHFPHAVPSPAAPLRSRFTREASADTGLAAKLPARDDGHRPGHARSKSFIFRQSPAVRKERDRDTGASGSGSHMLLAKSRKGSKIATMGDNIAISSPVPVEREPPPLHHQPPKRREQSVGRVSDNAAKRKSGDKLEVATKRRSGFTEAETNGCSRENLGELSMLPKPDHFPCDLTDKW